MAEVKQEAELGASPDEVWKVVGDFTGFIEAMGIPVESEGEGIGQLRKIAMGPDPIVERLEERDEAAKKVVYSIVGGPLPVADYTSTMQLAPAGDGRTKLTWHGVFEAPPGGDEAVSIATVNAVYDGGIKALQGRFGE
jgi:carbon monoxide dehydrogenase subunit G